LCCYALVSGQVPALTIEGLGVASAEGAAFVPAGAAGWQDVLAVLADGAVGKITYDAKALAAACLAAGTPPAGLAFDVFLAAYRLTRRRAITR
jgi:hypothetical protein